ncbi:MAG TPA: hypothetical protein VGD13_08080 [Xanthobacteraceae bacterium]|jgi:hypothetical protein
MNSNFTDMERHAKTLRAWQLAILRFAATLDNADRLAVLMIAAEMDGLGPQQDNKPEFRFFRKTSAELCGSILRPNELTSTALRLYLARIDNDRLKRIFAAAVEADRPKAPSISKPVRRDRGLWRGLSSRSSGF